MRCIKPLDSIRAIAVIFVIISHWIPSTYWINQIPIGGIGVDIFFVLSGFLISTILLDSRIKAEQANISNWTLVKHFYVRRALRIFPIYYLTIITLLIFSKSIGGDFQSAFVYHATYTSNFYFFNLKWWGDFHSHLWSLSVEEQFYLIWPWFILFADKKYLLPIISIFIMIGVTSQVLLHDVAMNSILTFSCFDAFGLGALLSWMITFADEHVKRIFRVISTASVISLVLLIIGFMDQQWLILPVRTLVSVVTMWEISYVVFNHESATLKCSFLLNNRVLIFLGKISYGLYLYHNIIPRTLNLKIINIYVNPLLPDIVFKKYWGNFFWLRIQSCWFLFLGSPMFSLRRNFSI